MDLSHFPKYQKFDPLVPVWCVTPDCGACLHRFFDTSPISPSGRYLAVFQMPREDRQPLPGEAGNVIVVDLQTGTHRIVAETCGWQPQLGANINWGGSDHELFFNDVDLQTWQPFAWKLDPLTGKKDRLEGTVYHASPDGRWLISANMATMIKTQSGYGVSVPAEVMRQNIGLAHDDGFYITDTSTGKRRLLLSLADAITQAVPAIRIENPNQYEFYGFHSKFNPQGDRLMLSIRWFPVQDRNAKEMLAVDGNLLRYAWVTVPFANGTAGPVSCAVGPEQWIKGGHHASWFPDGRRISMNLNIDWRPKSASVADQYPTFDEVIHGMRFVQVNADGSGLAKILDNVNGSGHPSLHPDGQHLITDAYNWEPLGYRDGSVPLRWIDLQSKKESVAIRIHTKQPHPDDALRIDPHPAWDRTWRYITFNAYIDGTRRVMLADMQNLLG